MINPFRTLTDRNLPEAFYTPRIVNMREFGPDGSFEELFQFAAMPSAEQPHNYTIQRFHKSLLVREAGNRPVVDMLMSGLDMAEAQDLAYRYYLHTLKECQDRRKDYADYKRLAPRTRNVPPPVTGYRWRRISADNQAMASPPGTTRFPLPQGFDRNSGLYN